MASMPAVEQLIHEFYQPSTSNPRKREIETELIAFKCHPQAWEICLRVAATGFESNQFLWFFCTSTLEHSITRRWNQLSIVQRQLLRETFWQTYANFANNVPRRQRDTFGQLIVLMGKREFPQDDANFLMHCIELIKSKFLLGINLLRVISEEVVSNKEDVTSERKQYFQSCVSQSMPDVMDLVTKYLLIAVCHINNKDIHSIPNHLMDYNLVATLPNDNQLSSAVLDLLNCAQHLVSWIKTEHISEYFLMSILDLSQWRLAYEDVSLAALSVLSELLYLQKPLPYCMTLMTGVNGLLDQHNINEDQNEIYVDKFRELLRMYTIKCWPKMMQENDLLERFLKSLYCCTIAKNGALDFTEKLEIWTPVIKGLVANSKFERYNDIMQQLVSEVMHRCQFAFNKSELELLDNEIMEDNTQTEWQQFIAQCIECVALVAESRPNAVFAQVYSHWYRPNMYFLSLTSSNSSELGLNGDDTNRKIEHLRDFATVCQALIRIAPLLDANSLGVGINVNSHLQVLSDNLLSLLQLLCSQKLTSLDDRSLFQTELDFLHAQVLMAICSFLPVIPNHMRTDELIHRLFDAFGKIFLPSTMVYANIVYMAASQLLLCISSVIRPKCLLSIPTMVSLMQAGSQLQHLPRAVVPNVYISVISYLILPWKNVEDQQQDFPQRCAVLCEYVESLSRNFLELNINAVTDAKAASIILSLLSSLSTVIEFFKDSSSTSREMLSTTFKPIITKALTIYNTLGLSNNSIAITVADFSLGVLRTLQTQLGSQFIKEMVALFINVSSREQLTFNRLAVIEKILQMFQLIVEQPGQASLAMLPSILDFTLEQILPMLHHDKTVADSSDITTVVYALFDSILNYKWQYFYKSHVQNNGSMLYTTSENLHPSHFLGILNAYGQVLVTGQDPSIVRSVLVSMNTVNDRWRLYQRPLFRDSLLFSFQGALISILLSGEGGLHFEYLVNALYAMGRVDSLKLRESFANAGFSVNSQIIEDICHTTDIPTFSQKISQLVQDAHCVLTQT